MTEESCSSCYWGELPPAEELSEDFAETLVQSAMKPVSVKLHEPCKEEDTEEKELPQECSIMDDTMLHTIKLLQYAKSMQSVIDKLKSKKSTVDSKELIPPIFPEQPERKPIHRMSYPFHYAERTSTPFMEGIGTPPHVLTDTNARLILRKCVATIFAHMGYDDTSQAVLDVMTDVSEDYFMKFTRLIRMAVDHEVLSGNLGFPDVMERTFHEMGIGSILVLHNFYQDRVLRYHQKTLAHCRKLAAEYANLTAPAAKQEITGEIVECKRENEEAEEYNIPEMHFPGTGDGCSADELRPSLEPGFQILHRIEQEEQLQNMVQEEEITVSDSPNH